MEDSTNQTRATWTRRPPIEPGMPNFLFSGTCYITERVREKLTDEDLDAILTDLLYYIKEVGSIEKRQGYRSTTGRYVYLDDSIERAAAKHLPSYRNYFIISLAEDESLVRKCKFSPHPTLIEYAIKEECMPTEEDYD